MVMCGSKKSRYVLVAAVMLLHLAGCAPGTVGSTAVGEAGLTPSQSIVSVVATVCATPDPSHTSTLMAAGFAPGQLEIHVLDVGHGDAQLIISPTGETMLIDVGRKEYTARTAEYLRQVLGGDLAVDYLMFSHYHGDHMQAFIPLMEEGLRIRRVILDRGGDRDEFTAGAWYGAFYDHVSDPANGLTRVRVYPGDQIDLGPDITVDVLSVGDIDTRTACGVPVLGENDNSIALWLTYGDFDYWTAGDLTGEPYHSIEAAVIPLLPREVDVYRANHHAREQNNSPEFLSVLNPTVSIASTSSKVAHWNTIVALEEYGDLYITGEIPLHEASGDIVLTTRDGGSYTVEGKSYVSKP